MLHLIYSFVFSVSVDALLNSDSQKIEYFSILYFAKALCHSRSYDDLILYVSLMRRPPDGARVRHL